MVQPHPSKHLVEQSYDRIAPEYLKWTSSFSSPRLTFLDKLLPLLPSRSSTAPAILELGCGAGVPCTQILAKCASRLVAVDISSAQLELAKENVEGGGGGDGTVEFLKKDMHELEFADESFDAVLGFYSIIHLPREEQVAMMEKVGAWLKPGGYFLANFAAGESEENWNENWLVEGSGMFWSSWDEGKTLKMVRGAGLEVLEGSVVWEDEGSAGERNVGFLWVFARKGEGVIGKGDGKVE